MRLFHLFFCVLQHSALVHVLKGHPLPSTPIYTVFNVRQYGAAGDGATDDTNSFLRTIVAIQDRMNSTTRWHPHYPSVLYVPSGRYVVKDTLQLYPDDPVDCTGLSCVDWRMLMISVMGESTDTTTIVLPDNSVGFADKDNTKPVFLTHPHSRLFNNGQWLGYYDFTLEIGDGNAGAVGIRHASNNIGQIANVQILYKGSSEDCKPAAGIDFPIFLGGIILFKNIRVNSFSIGINISQPQDITVAQNIEILNCPVGISLEDKGLGVRNMTAVNVTTGILSMGSSASLTLVDCHFSASGRNILENMAAVVSHGGQLYARNITATNFSAAIFDYATNASDSKFSSVRSPVSEYSHASAVGVFPHVPHTATGLRARSTPEVAYDAPHLWAIANLNSSIKDNTPIIQAAIDSGARTVMLNGSTPNVTGGTVYYRLASPVIVRGNVERLHGGWLGMGTEGKGVQFPALRVDASAHGKPVVIEAMSTWGYQHNSPTDVVFRLVTCGQAHGSDQPCYLNSGTGDVFFESVNFGGNLAAASQSIGMVVGPTHQNVYAEALDIEGYRNHIHNQGSNVLLFGFKLGETEGKPYLRSVGGQSELMAGLLNSFSCQNGNASLQPCQAFEMNDTDASVIGVYTTEAGSYESATVVETFHGQTAQATSKAFPLRWTWWPSSNVSAPPWVRVGYHIPFYRSAWATSGPTPPPVPPTPAPPPPPPPSPPSPPISPACMDTLHRVCPREQGKGRECETCCHNHTKDMLNGGCVPAKDGSLYNIIKPFCNLSDWFF
eukprot:m.607986 g.607986  ORF g.607986 m.607986 type:complete len:778 (+) comp22483_c0_seq2:155-2488(+)